MSLETWTARYPVTDMYAIKNQTLREVVQNRNEMADRPFIWSARLSTGIFGLPDCKSGNAPYAPKGENEVMLAVGDEGLESLLNFGFVPCPTCHPEEQKGFWEKTKEAILNRYPFLLNERQILNRDLVPFDSRRVDWEIIAPFIKKLPNRLYVPQDLSGEELRTIKIRFTQLGFDIPPVGYYDKNAPGRFAEYKLP